MNIEVGDYIKISNLVNSEVIEIQDNIYKLQNGNSVTVKNGNMQLLIEIEPNQFKVIKKNQEELPIYPMLKILKEVDHDTFLSICKTNTNYNAICNGTLNDEQKRKYGDLTEELYEARVKNFFDMPEMILYRNPKLTWRQLYNQYITTLKNISVILNNTNTYIYQLYGPNLLSYLSFLLGDALKNNNIFLLIILLSRFHNLMNVSSVLDHSVHNENINIIKYLLSIKPPLQFQHPMEYYADYAKNNNKTKVLEYFASLNPPILPTN